MISHIDDTYQNICKWAGAHGIQVSDDELPRGRAGEFNGVSVTMNRAYSSEERAYYLVHALGSIVLWSLNKDAVQSVFNELRAANKSKDADPASLESSIQSYRKFEIESSEYAVSLLAELGGTNSIASYINFMRADLEALTEFHRHGRAPVWRDFFACWNDEVDRGKRQVSPFKPRLVPPFEPKHIENQEILQEQG